MLEINHIKLSTINSGASSSKIYKNRDDLLLVELPENTVAAGVFCRSSFAAAPVNWCKKIIKKAGNIKALIVNAGNANSFTGRAGDQALLRIVKEVAKLLNCQKEQVLMSSTGVIGQQLKDDKIIEALPTLITGLSGKAESWRKAAKAIMTTDLVDKYWSAVTKINGKEVKINGFAKGSGMIAPNMATLLAYIFTDANIEAGVLQSLLRSANEESFNSITVDSDHSTNDTALLFATGTADNDLITDIDDPNLAGFKQALQKLMINLAKQVVRDGEGATKLITVRVLNAASKKAAKNIALSIANSPLVKTAIAGCDPNWGRIVMAIGKSEEKVNQKGLDIKIGNFTIVENGSLSASYNEGQVHQYLQQEKVEIEVNINLKNDPQNSATIWTCDLTEGYIKINKDYRT